MKALSKYLDRIGLTSIITLVLVIVGGVVVIWYPQNIDQFKEYAIAVGAGGGGLGILGLARSAVGKGK